LHLRLRLDPLRRTAAWAIGNYFKASRNLRKLGVAGDSPVWNSIDYHVAEEALNRVTLVAKSYFMPKGFFLSPAQAYATVVRKEVKKTGLPHIELMLRKKLPKKPAGESGWGKGWHGNSPGHSKARRKASEVLFNSVEPTIDGHLQDTDEFL